MDKNFDIIVQKIMSEVGCDKVVAMAVANKLKTIHPELNKLVEAWLKDDYVPFEYKTRTIHDIMAEEKCSYFEAIFSMDEYMKNNS